MGAEPLRTFEEARAERLAAQMRVLCVAGDATKWERGRLMSGISADGDLAYIMVVEEAESRGISRKTLAKEREVWEAYRFESPAPFLLSWSHYSSAIALSCHPRDELLALGSERYWTVREFAEVVKALLDSDLSDVEQQALVRAAGDGGWARDVLIDRTSEGVEDVRNVRNDVSLADVGEADEPDGFPDDSVDDSADFEHDAVAAQLQVLDWPNPDELDVVEYSIARAKQSVKLSDKTIRDVVTAVLDAVDEWRRWRDAPKDVDTH